MSCAACEQNPPVLASDYKPKGDYITLANTKTYSIGPDTATRLIIGVYDIFGIHPCTLQGADRLAASLKDTKVLVPDFFKGDAADLSWVPMDNDEKKSKLMNFMTTKGDFKNNSATLEEIVKAVQETFSSVKVLGAYGLCWGGKLIAVNSAKGTPFAATAQAHPGRPTVEDAQAIDVPHCCLLTPEDGDADTLKAYEAELNKKPHNFVEMYSDMIHGFMGARARLEVKRNSDEFERGYNKFTEFFEKHCPN